MQQFAFPPPPTVTVPIAGDTSVFPVRRIYCVGRNYTEHAVEMGFTGREPPFFFMKPSDAALPVATGVLGSLPYPSNTSDYHYEAEVVVAIGKAGSKISAANAAAHIFGYALGLDMTRRDLQMAMRKQGRPWDIGKSFDASAPIGPIHRRSDIGDVSTGRLWLSVNGEIRQDSDISKLIWSIPEIIEHLSAYFELMPGDLVYTGTPEGVGVVWPGEVIALGADGLGEMRVRVL
jgi:fumarylpyruvate hydrolase